MRVGSLFSGIGGLDLGLERAGMTVVWQSEIDPYASRVLVKHWPHVPNLGDITMIDWSTVELVDLICGGYPCQPFSVAGLRAGESDARHLWPFMFDAIRILRPRFALLENVPGHLGLGFDTVLGDLASIGFDAEWSALSACAVGAPHMRRRLFCVAYSRETRPQGLYITRGAEHLQPVARSVRRQWRTEPDVARVANGLPRRLVNRIERTQGLGNAVVPQVAEWVGRRIMEAVA